MRELCANVPTRLYAVINDDKLPAGDVSEQIINMLCSIDFLYYYMDLIVNVFLVS